MPELNLFGEKLVDWPDDKCPICGKPLGYGDLFQSARNEAGEIICQHFKRLTGKPYLS